MKILVVEKYKGFEDYIERYRIYFGKDEGEYYQNDDFTGLQGIRAKCKQLKNNHLDYYGDYCCTGALTKYGVIQDVLGGNGYVEGYVPDITIKDLELNITWMVADYMERNGLTKLDGGIIAGEKMYNDIYGKNVNYVDCGIVVTNNGWREHLAIMAKRYTPEQLKERGITEDNLIIPISEPTALNHIPDIEDELNEDEEDLER